MDLHGKAAQEMQHLGGVPKVTRLSDWPGGGQ